MPGIDWIPGVAQLKIIVQAASGDLEGARRTNENFVKECPGVSQVTSAIQLATGDVEGAKETQMRCLGTVSNVANGIPVVGHAKGLIQHAYGDHEGGNRALNAATRSTVVVASGAAAAVATGGIAAIPAGIAAGVSYDAGATVVTGEEQGYIAAIKNVAENPSAGAVFDACAIPVGDGLAGYSGGQMATKIQLSHLESVKLSKLDQMDAAATSMERVQFGNEAMAAQAKINTIKHGTPYLYSDPKTGTVISEAYNPNTAVPVPGYVDESEGETRSAHIGVTVGAAAFAASVARVVIELEDAIYNDSYVENMTITDNNRQDAQKKLYQRDQQKPGRGIHDAYKGTKFTTPEALSDLLDSINGDPNRNPDRPPITNMSECLRELFSWAWLLLIMPTEFAFTVAAQLNSVYGGYYHSFIRHMDEWAQVIPSDLSRVVARLDPLITEIRAVTAANNVSDAAAARDAFVEARRQLSRETSNDVQAAFSDMQLSIHRFIQRNMTFENYQGRSLNMNGQERLFFRVETESGTKAMVICLTEERFQPTAGDSRPLRMLLTVYFETWAEFRSHGMLETKEEMEERAKE